MSLFVLSGLSSGRLPTPDQEQPSSTLDRVPVYLNHLFLTLDPETYEAIIQSDFINSAFAALEERTTIAGDTLSWTGAYLYGHHTYLEFFSTEQAPPGAPCGIAFGVETPGGLETIRAQLDAHLEPEVAAGLRSRRLDSQEIPWFYLTGVRYPSEELTLSSWVMEYHEAFLQRWHPHLPPVDGGIARASILARYAAKVAAEQARETAYFKDVIGISAVLSRAETVRFVRELLLLGYQEQDGSAQRLFTGPDLQITLYADDTATSGIKELTLSTHRPKQGRREYHFGPHSRLTFHDDGTATWYFI